MRRFLLVGLAALLLAMPSTGVLADQRDPGSLSFGVVPQQAASRLARLWVPILDRVSRETGINLRFATAKNIPTFEERLAEGAYDFAYMNPYHYTVFHRFPGYRAIARQRDKKIQGLIVVRRDSPIQAIAELDGQTLAFPAPAAFAASVLPRAHFRREGIAITPRYVASHDSVYLTVAKGVLPAGGGIVRTLGAMRAEVRDQLRVLWRTERFTPHAIAAHPDIEPVTERLVRDSLVGLAADDPGRAMLRGLNMKGIEAAQDSDWDDVRALGIDLLEDLVKGR